VLVAEEDLHKTYFRFAINHRLEELIGKAHGGVGLRHVTKGKFQATEVPLPPLAEQQRIVAKIEALQERSRNAREALAEVGPLLEQFRQSLLAAAFRGDLTADWRAARTTDIPVRRGDTGSDRNVRTTTVETAHELLSRIRTERRHRWEQSELAKYKAKNKQPPKGWQEKYQAPEPLQEDELEILRDQTLPKGWLWAPAELIVEPEAEIVYGIVQPGKKLEEGVPYVRGKDIVDGIIQVDQLLKTSQKIAAKYERASLKGGDVLLGIIRATKVAIVPDVLEGANVTQGTARFRPSSIIRTKFLAGWLDSPSAQNWLHDHYRGIDMPGLNLRDVRRLPIPIAPLAEQAALEAQLARTIEPVANAKLHAAESESSLTRLDQSILAKAFRGELVPQDPNDEPASVLLERIREARMRLQPHGKRSHKGGSTKSRTNKKHSANTAELAIRRKGNQT
jgi:type I restriction enzyme S subunit